MLGYREQLYVEIVYNQVRFLRKKKKNGEESLLSALESVAWQSVEVGGPNEAGSAKAAESELTLLLKNYREKNWGQRKITVYLLIPFRTGLIREFRLPWLPNRERASAVFYYIRHELPGLNEDFIWDYQVEEDVDKQFLTVRLTSIRQDTIRAYAGCFMQAGYDLRGIEYSVSALAETLAPDAKFMLFQTIADSRTQMVLYRHKFPQVIREFETDQPDTVRYHISLVLKGQEGPLDFVITDGSSQAEQIASLLNGPARVEPAKSPIFSSPTSCNVPNPADVRALALVGGIERIRTKRNYNFYKFALRPQKVKTFLVCSALSLFLVFALGLAFWYPSVAQYMQLEREISTLQDQVEEFRTGPDLLPWREWTTEQQLSDDRLQQIGRAVAILDNDLTVIRLNYQQGTLTLWLECRNNAVITRLIGNLTDQGWKEPRLLDYQYKNQQTTFCLSVKK